MPSGWLGGTHDAATGRHSRFGPCLLTGWWIILYRLPDHMEIGVELLAISAQEQRLLAVGNKYPRFVLYLHKNLLGKDFTTAPGPITQPAAPLSIWGRSGDRKSTRLNSSH